jgi:hypothetical protein
MQQVELIQLLDELCALPVETDWLEFYHSYPLSGMQFGFCDTGRSES